jgi:hypothetical protein
MQTVGRVYGREVFSAKYIGIQILTVNAAFYAIYTTLMLVMGIVTRRDIPRMHELFTAAEMGSSGIAVLSITAALLSWVLKVVVERSRKILDFVVTVHFFHFLLSWMIGGFPRKTTWWIGHGLAVAVSTIGGETLCRKEENADIVITSLERE